MSFLDYDPHVIPLIANGKKPAKKFENVEFNLGDVFEGAKKGKNNIGLLAQPNFVFVDIDTPQGHGTDGIGNFLKWCGENKIDCEKLVEETLVQKTPTGSIHLIFRKNPRYEIKQVLNLLEGVDIKGSDNNFIVIAPSTVDGKKYSFIDPKKDPIVMPDDLACAIVKRKNQIIRRNKQSVKNGGLTSEGLKYTQAFSNKPILDVFYTIRNGFGNQGFRNKNVFRWSQAMRMITDKDTVIEYGKIANANGADPIPEKELVATIESAFSFIRPPEIIEMSNENWVKLEKCNFAVLESTFYDHNGNYSADDYDEKELYLCGANANFESEKQTIFNYGRI